MKWPNMPKFRFKRVNIERALIGCSAMLVLLLSVQDRNLEPYEEPLEEIPQAQVAASAPVQDLQQTVVYYEDGEVSRACPAGCDPPGRHRQGDAGTDGSECQK